MKRYNIAIIAAVMGCSMVNAQNYVDAARFNKCDYEGTARSQAMGSAFGALGADMTSQSINPAGLAAYRATEMGMGLGVNCNNTETNYYGFSSEEDKVSVPFSNIGITFNFGNRPEGSGIVNQAFSIAYSRLADYNRYAKYSDSYGYNSMLDYFCNDDQSNDQAHKSYTGGLAYDAGWIIDPTDSILMTTNVWESPFDLYQLDEAARMDENGDGAIDHYQYVKENGYKGETSFSYALSVSNLVYIGAAMGIQSISYREIMTHEESYYGTYNGNAYASYRYGSELKQDATGINVKLGAIVKPINALRVGFAIHSPTLFNVQEKYNSWIDGAYDNNVYYSPSGDYKYNYRAPGKFVASAAGIIGKYGIVSFDFERTNYGKGKFKDEEGGTSQEYDAINQNVKDAMKVSRTFRVGVEGRIADVLYVRGGYSAQTTPYKKHIMINDYRHDAICGGIGFRVSNFFIDLSYVCRRTKDERWVLPDGDYAYEENLPATIDSKSHNYTLSFGYRF